MVSDNSDIKLKKNVTRTVGISALRKIGALVDGYEAQDQKNKRRVVVICIVLLALIVMFTIGLASREPANTVLKSSPNKSFVRDAEPPLIKWTPQSNGKEVSNAKTRLKEN